MPEVDGGPPEVPEAPKSEKPDRELCHLLIGKLKEQEALDRIAEGSEESPYREISLLGDNVIGFACVALRLVECDAEEAKRTGKATKLSMDLLTDVSFDKDMKLHKAMLTAHMNHLQKAQAATATRILRPGRDFDVNSFRRHPFRPPPRRR